jgi:hypothetical protein
MEAASVTELSFAYDDAAGVAMHWSHCSLYGQSHLSFVMLAQTSSQILKKAAGDFNSMISIFIFVAA